MLIFLMLIILFLPPLISLLIEKVLFKVKIKQEMVFRYSLYLLLINSFCMVGLVVFMENNMLIFGLHLLKFQFVIKYVLMSICFSIFIPIAIKIIKKFNKKTIVDFFKKVKKKITFNNILLIFLLIQPVLELYPFYNSFTSLFRVVCITLFFVYSLKKNYNKKILVSILIYLLIILLYFFFHNIHSLKFNTLVPINYSTLNEILYFIKMLTPFMLIYVIYVNIIKEEQFKTYLKFTVGFISLIIIITNLFEISLSSYTNEIIKGNIFDWFFIKYSFDELASKGWFYFANHIIAILIMFLPITYYFMLKERKNVYYFLFIIQMLALLLLGNKTSVFGSFLVFLSLILLGLFYFKKNFLIKTNIIVNLLILMCFPLLIFYSPAVNRVLTFEGTNINYNISKTEKEKNNTYIRNNYEEKHISKNFIEKFYPYKYDSSFWVKMLKEPEYKLINYRYLEVKIMNRVFQVNNSSFDYFLGMGYDRQMKIVNVERDILNQFYSLGIIGLILLVIPYFILIFVSLYKIVKNKKYELIFVLYSVILFILVSILGGNLLNSLSATLPFAVLCGLLYRKSRFS